LWLIRLGGHLKERTMRSRSPEGSIPSSTVHPGVHSGGGASRSAPTERLTADERTELLTLRREGHPLRQERDILKNATAFFAKPSE
jgi:transposase-like protein